MNNDTGEYREKKNHQRNDLISGVNTATKPSIGFGAGQEGSDHEGYDDVGDRIEERLQSIIIIARGILRGVQSQEIAVGPEETKRATHQYVLYSYADHREVLQAHHHQHGESAQKHSETIQVRNLYAFEQKAVHTKRNRYAGVYGQLIDCYNGGVIGTAHDVGPNKYFDHRQHESIDHVGNEQHTGRPWQAEKYG